MSDIRKKYKVDLTQDKVTNAFYILNERKSQPERFRYRPQHPDDLVYLYIDKDPKTGQVLGRWVRAGDYFPASYFKSNKPDDRSNDESR